MKNSILFVVIIGCAAPLSSTQAAIYKIVDNEGNITYSNMPAKGATKLDIEGSAPQTALDKGLDKTERSNRVRTPTPVNFPRVDNQTQNQRDDKRKQILASELETEQKALQEAKKIYADNAPQPSPTGKIDPSLRPDDKLQRLQAEVDSHEKNVQLLQKELHLIK